MKSSLLDRARADNDIPNETACERNKSKKGSNMPALILWLLGVPISVIILLYLLF